MLHFTKTSVLLVFAFLTAFSFVESLNADVIWTKRDTPSYTDTASYHLLGGSFTSIEAYNKDKGELTFGTDFRYGKDTESNVELSDKSKDTKLCVTGSVGTTTTNIMNGGSSTSVIYTAPKGWANHTPLLQYSITTANDAPDRDPDDWTIYGSNDGGTTWEALTTVTNAAIPGKWESGSATERKVMLDFPITAQAYNQYKFEFTGSKSSNTVFQMAELSLWTAPIITDTTPNFNDNAYGNYVPLKATGYLALKDGVEVKSSSTTWYFGANETIDKLVDRNVADSSGKTKVCVVGKGDTTDVFNNFDSFSIDFSASTKELIKSADVNKKGTDGKIISQTLQLPDYVIQYSSLNAYAITTGNDAFARNPENWTLSGSNDKTNWTTLDQMTGAQLPDKAYQMCTIPLAEGTKAYDYYRLTITDTKGVSQSFQFSEFSVWGNKSAQIKIPTSAIKEAKCTFNAEKWWFGNGEGITNLYDGKSDKMCIGGLSADNGNIPSAETPVSITFEMTDPIAVGSYSFTTANDASGRDPASWTLSGSTDGLTWATLDTISDIALSSERFITQNFDIENDEAYRYYKFDFTKTRSATPDAFQIAEITFYSQSMDINMIPEPSTFCLLGLGILGLMLKRRKKTNNE